MKAILLAAFRTYYTYEWCQNWGTLSSGHCLFAAPVAVYMCKNKWEIIMHIWVPVVLVSSLHSVLLIASNASISTNRGLGFISNKGQEAATRGCFYSTVSMVRRSLSRQQTHAHNIIYSPSSCLHTSHDMMEGSTTFIYSPDRDVTMIQLLPFPCYSKIG